jgi:hypothetical protein
MSKKSCKPWGSGAARSSNQFPARHGKVLHKTGWDAPWQPLLAHVTNAHLIQLGAVEYPHSQFLRLVTQLTQQSGQPGNGAEFAPPAQLSISGRG